MFSAAVDEEAFLVVHRFSGPDNADADYEAYCTSIIDLNRMASGSLMRVAILCVDADNPIPNASWRKKIADASANVDPNTLFVLVSDRTVVRGILTALNWLRPPTFHWSITKSFDEALEVVANHRLDAAERLRELRDDCDAQARRRAR